MVALSAKQRIDRPLEAYGGRREEEPAARALASSLALRDDTPRLPVTAAGRLPDRRRILLCDAESQSLHALRVVLHGAGFAVDATRTAEEALDRSAVCLPAAAIVELTLPDGDGVEVCRRLRQWSEMPVIMLSAVYDEGEQVRALEAGADDFVRKPFRPRELVARLNATLRRVAGAAQPCVALGGLEIDLAAHTVRRDGEEIHLTPIEFSLLGALVRNRGRLMTHNALLQQVWGPGYLDARQTLRAHVANLRRKIEPSNGEPLIHTDHGVGYRLVDRHPSRPWRAPPADGMFGRDVTQTRLPAFLDATPSGLATPVPARHTMVP